MVFSDVEKRLLPDARRVPGTRLEGSAGIGSWGAVTRSPALLRAGPLVRDGDDPALTFAPRPVVDARQDLLTAMLPAPVR